MPSGELQSDLPTAKGGAPCVDWRIALSMVSGQQHLLRGLVEASLAENPRLIVELRTALDRGAADHVLFHAHTLKSALAYLGAEHAADLAGQLEALAHAGMLTDAAGILTALEGEFERVQSELAQYLLRKDT